ncbi:aldehyde dehydrogenase family protein [Sporosarcina beigongshangi]|uniref:aldehyde dehydrogenase family protein n=1 Tax=Sporosarcina beigongshangi TaxID=2782538 RepID=UPI001939D279|nr:aldehyde dehydrogenase family protein [Sporosarcina beigongshangi]
MNTVQNIETIQLSKVVSDFLNEEKKLFIGGEFVSSSSNNTFQTLNPANNEVLAEIHEASEEDVNSAVQAAKDAFENGQWSTMTPLERGDLIYKLAILIDEHKQYIAEIDSLDNGKPLAELLENDLPNAIGQFKYFSGWASKLMGQHIPVNGDFLNYTRHEPIGVVGQIIPWNFPFMMAAWKIAPALAAGCTIILKSAEQTPLSALYLAKLVQEAGFPKGVINIVSGHGETTGAALVKHPLVNKIAFTGSTEVGKIIMKEAANTMKRVTLELGGKSPNIILKDADLDKAAEGVFAGIMYNQGEVCSAGSRAYVHSSIYEEFVDRLVNLAKKVKLGTGLQSGITMGPLVSEEQKERVINYIEIGKSEGAKLVYGGGASEQGCFVEPTIFGDVEDDMRISREEIFGPVLVVSKFENELEVVERANDSEYGLGAGVWTENITKAHKIANKLKSGSIWINCYNATDPASPFGGFKNSGFGREMGSYALENYTEVKSIWVNLN